MRLLILPILLAATCMAAQPKPAGVDALSAEDIAKAISALRHGFVRHDSLSDAEMARATLQGLLDRLSPAITLESGSTSVEAAAPFYSEIYDGRIGYLRVGAFNKGNIAKAYNAVKDWSAKNVGSVVLDLRGTPANGDFAMGWMLAGMFCANGTQLFRLESMDSKGTQGEAFSMSELTYIAGGWPIYFKGILVVLVDGETAEAPEAVAAALQKCAKALVVGDRTAGRAFQYKDVPLSGAVLRIPVGQVILPDGKQPGANGLMPDIAVGLGAGKQEVMQAITAKGVAAVVSEHSRPHLNEAALVAGGAPEVDEIEAEQAGHKPQMPIIDRQLQRALDLVTSISIYQAKGSEPVKTGT